MFFEDGHGSQIPTDSHHLHSHIFVSRTYFAPTQAFTLEWNADPTLPGLMKINLPSCDAWNLEPSGD